MDEVKLTLLTSSKSVPKSSEPSASPRLAVVDPVYFRGMERFSELMKSALALNGPEPEITSELLQMGPDLFFRYSCEFSNGLDLTYLSYIQKAMEYVDRIELIPVKRGLLRLVVTIKATISPEAYKSAKKET